MSWSFSPKMLIRLVRPGSTILYFRLYDYIFRWGAISANIRGFGDQEGGEGGRGPVHLSRHRPRHRGDGGARHRAPGDVRTPR